MLVKKLVIVLRMWGILSASERAVEKGPLIHEAFLDFSFKPLPLNISSFHHAPGGQSAFLLSESPESSAGLCTRWVFCPGSMHFIFLKKAPEQVPGVGRSLAFHTFTPH